MRDSFVFYRSFKNAICKIRNSEDRLALYDAITDYALDGVEPSEDVSELISVLMETIKPQIDANNVRYENGKKGGRPKNENKKPVVSKLKTSGFESENHRFLDSKPNVNVDVNADVYADEDGDVSGSSTNTDAESLSLSLISYLNEKTGSRYRPKSAEQRIQNLLEQGYSEADMRKVIDRKYSEWFNDEKMRDYLRPSTLFGNKFSEYLNAPISIQGERQQKKEENRNNLAKQKAEKMAALKSIRESIEEMKDGDGRIRNNLQEYRALKEQAAMLEDSLTRINSILEVN